MEVNFYPMLDYFRVSKRHSLVLLCCVLYFGTKVVSCFINKNKLKQRGLIYVVKIALYKEI